MIKFFTANLQWKALSVLLALVLWSFVVGEPELVTSQAVPILYKNLSRDLEISSEVPDSVHLEIRGPVGKLAQSNFARTAVLFDLSPVQGPGEQTFTVTDGGINLPIGVELLRAVPSQLRLHFDRILGRSIPIKVRTGAEPPAGYSVVSEEVLPKTLRILGPEAHVKSIAWGQTDPIDLSSVVGRTEFHVHAYVDDPQVRFDGSPLVTVLVDVEKQTGH
jgi:hypothetical protein